jgi:carbon-monoxide dehydrogenase large subunit
VVNAVVDAVRHLGVNDIQMPCTPERVWKAINGPGSGGSSEGAAMPHFGEQGAAGNQEQPGTASTEGAGS